MSTPVNPKAEAGRARKYQMDLARYYRIPAVQSSLSVVLSLFIVAFFLVFALRPTFVTIVKLQKTIDDSEKTLAQLTTKVAALQKASTALEKLESSLPMINAHIPAASAGYQTLTSEVELLAAQSGVNLTALGVGETLLYSRILSPFKPVKTQSVTGLVFTTRVTGSYPAIVSFLQSIMKMDRLIKLESVTIAKEGSVRGSTAGTTSLTLNGQAYYLAEQTQLQKAIPQKKGGK